LGDLKLNGAGTTAKLAKPGIAGQSASRGSRPSPTAPLRDGANFQAGSSEGTESLSDVVAKAKAAQGSTAPPTPGGSAAGTAKDAQGSTAPPTPGGSAAGTAKDAQGSTAPPTPGGSAAGTAKDAQGSTAPPTPGGSAAGTAPAAQAPSGADATLVLAGVPVGTPLPVTVDATVDVKGTATVSKNDAECCEIRLQVKGKLLFATIERDVTVSLTRQADGSFLYRSKDNGSGEISEGIAKDIEMAGNVRRLKVVDKKADKEVPVVITDLGGGHFKIKGDGFEADINPG
jgi:hypothetical protein